MELQTWWGPDENLDQVNFVFEWLIFEYWIRWRVPVCVYTVFKTLSWKRTVMKCQIQFHNSFGTFVHWLSDIYFLTFNAFLWIFKSFNYKRSVHGNCIFFFQEHNSTCTEIQTNSEFQLQKRKADGHHSSKSFFYPSD